MVESFASTLIRKAERLRSERLVWDAHYEEIAEHLFPYSSDFVGKKMPGTKIMSKVGTTVGAVALRTLADSLHSLITSPHVQWFRLLPRDQRLYPRQSIRKYLETVTYRMYQVFNSGDSGFQTAAAEVYHNVVAFGTGIMSIETQLLRGRPWLIFRSHSLKDTYIEENSLGMVDTVYRFLELTAKQAIQEFGVKNVSHEILNSLELGDDKTFKFLHVILPNLGYQPGKLGLKGMPFSAYYIDTTNYMIVRSGGYTTNPYIVWRWAKSSWDIYGNSPAMMALPDVKVLNEMAIAEVRAAQLSSSPALQAPSDGFMNPIRVVPNYVNYFNSGEMGRIEPIPLGANIQPIYQSMELKKQDVKSAFYLDYMEMYKGDRMVTAEVLTRRDEQMRLLSPIMSRCQAELLAKILDRSFDSLLQNRIIDPLPSELGTFEDIDVQFLSPLAISQKASGTDNITRMMQLIGPILQLDPTAAQLIDVTEIIRAVGEMLDIQTGIIRTPEEYAQLQQQQQQQQQMAMQLQSAQSIAGSIKDASIAASNFQQSGNVKLIP